MSKLDLTHDPVIQEIKQLELDLEEIKNRQFSSGYDIKAFLSDTGEDYDWRETMTASSSDGLNYLGIVENTIDPFMIPYVRVFKDTSDNEITIEEAIALGINFYIEDSKDTPDQNPDADKQQFFMVVKTDISFELFVKFYFLGYDEITFQAIDGLDAEKRKI